MVKAYVKQADALDYLQEYPQSPEFAGWAIFTSMPDAEEMSLPLDQWAEWFKTAASRIMLAIRPDGYAIFYQTDRKAKGALISKAQIILKMADVLGLRVVFHKICSTTKGANLFRPGYTHLICISKKGTSGKATPDVFPAGKKLYKNATGYDACTCVFDFLKDKGIAQVLDPFCGAGSIGYIGAKMGFESINIDIDGAQCLAATVLIQSVKDAEVTTLSGQR